MINIEALFSISYGLYIVCSGDKKKGNGYISNTVFQVSSKPAKFAACCNKENYTCNFIEKHQAFSVSVIDQETSSDIIGIFGFKSGKEFNKLDGFKVKYGTTGVPIVLDSTIATLEFKVTETIDVGTHLMFIAELIETEVIDNSKEPLTYAFYRQVKKGLSPKNAPTYVDKSEKEKTEKNSTDNKHECLACGFIYDDEIEGTHFDALADDWKCPVCGADKSDFDLI